jgi:Trk K+ transport system NAD-binding subunit
MRKRNGVFFIKDIVGIPQHSPAGGKAIVDLGIPYSVHIMAIKRGEQYVQPIGSTTLMSGDTLYLIADDAAALKVVVDSLNAPSFA